MVSMADTRLIRSRLRAEEQRIRSREVLHRIVRVLEPRCRAIACSVGNISPWAILRTMLTWVLT